MTGIADLVATALPADAVRAVLPSGSFADTVRWNSAQALGTAVTLSYYFSDLPPDYEETGRGYTAASAQPWSAQRKSQIEQVLGTYSAVAGVSFVAAAGAAQADMSFFLSNTLTVGGFAYFPGLVGSTGTAHGDVYLDIESFAQDVTANELALHEIGHALGLAHAYPKFVNFRPLSRPRRPLTRMDAGFDSKSEM